MLKNPIYIAARRQRFLEAALAMGICLALMLATTAAQTQRQVAEKMVRLHILANSDSDHDQAVKLQVRDDLLAHMEHLTELPELQQLETWANASLAAQGEPMHARAERVRMYFDTREYESFALPAGYYDAVRIILGEGKGKNWWCVLFPPLCTGACEAVFEETALQHGMTPGEVAFVTREGVQYRLRFKTAELLWELLHRIGGI